MVTVIEADLQHQAGIAAFGFQNTLDVLQISAGGLLAKYVLAGVQRRNHDVGNEAIRSAHKHRIDLRLDHGLIVWQQLHVFKAFGRRIWISAANQHGVFVFANRAGANAAHLAQSDNTNFDGITHGIKPSVEFSRRICPMEMSISQVMLPGHRCTGATPGNRKLRRAKNCFGLSILPESLGARGICDRNNNKEGISCSGAELLCFQPRMDADETQMGHGVVEAKMQLKRTPRSQRILENRF